MPPFSVVLKKLPSLPCTSTARGFRPTFSLGRNLTQPLKNKCSSFAEMRKFLSKCRHSREHQTVKTDYWQPSDEFEETRTGDCVDFALWAWRQLLDMGYSARFVGGKAGKFGEGHAWVTFEKDGKFFLLEPGYWMVGLRLPRLSALRYRPETSVAWDGEKICFYVHKARNTEPPLGQLPALVGEWIVIWTRFWARVIPRIPTILFRRVPRNHRHVEGLHRGTRRARRKRAAR